ncbi:sugar acetyltransferase [Solibacillus sp. R5-41]|uniref:acetyltransferase n=1 Tax=Solibacillus sp. R5-41 TaxID=2048654 RepID=UPI000C128A35|nr:acetyltransferase [Solibacillus sp. R5-41]ATP42352.1 sugar acetyltransferase [Solibacillus sp. R5-41]
MNKPVIVIGNGGHAAVLAETLLQQEREILGYTAPAKETNKFQLDYLGTDSVIASFKPEDIELVLGIGTVNRSTVRKTLFEGFKELGYIFGKVVHDTAYIAPSAKIGDGVQIMAGVILQSHVEIADNTIINTGTIIDHDTKICSHVHVAPGTNISGGVKIGEQTHVGTGTTIIQNIEIGRNCLIGAGSVVVKNIPHDKKVYGVPAKEV